MEQNPKPKSPWRYILFYYDPADPRVMVPKRIPIFGWTLNVGHKFSWVILFLIAAFIAACVYKGQAHLNLP